MFSFKKRASGDVPTPAADKVTVFVDDSGNIKRKDEAGTVEDLASGGIPESLIDAAGDLIVGDGADSAARLAIGTAGQVLTVNAGATAPEWAAATGGIAATLLDAKGDLIVASAADTAARLAVGTDGQVLVADAASDNGIKWDDAPSGTSVYGALAHARVTTTEALASGTYADLATPGPAVTITVPASGVVEVTLGMAISLTAGDADQSVWMGVVLSGANTVAADQNNAFGAGIQSGANGSRTFVLTGLSAGSTTFTAKYRQDDGNISTNVRYRSIIVRTLP